MSSKHDALGKNYRARKTNAGPDFFPTYHSHTRLLMDVTRYSIKDGIFLEPCAGAGDISKIIREYHPNSEIRQYDIEPRADGVIKADFLTMDIEEDSVDYVVMNPPFTAFMEFLERCTHWAKKAIYVLAPLDYLHGVERNKRLFRIGLNYFCLTRVYVFVRRPLFGVQYHPAGPAPTGATSFAWFHFNYGAMAPPTISWLDNEKCMGVPWESEQLVMI